MGDELKEGVLYAMLRAVARIGAETEIPIKTQAAWIRIAQFHELRSTGMTVVQASRAMGVSEPTGARIARELRTSFLNPETDHELPKRIAFMLWAGPMSRKKISQVLPTESDENISKAIEILLDSGRIEEIESRTTTDQVTQVEDRIVGPAPTARLGALNSLLESVTKTVSARFFRNDKSAFARTVSFRMREEDEPELQKFYTEQLWPFLAELEKRSENELTKRTTQLSILWVSENQEPEDGDTHA